MSVGLLMSDPAQLFRQTCKIADRQLFLASLEVFFNIDYKPYNQAEDFCPNLAITTTTKEKQMLDNITDRFQITAWK